MFVLLVLHLVTGCSSCQWHSDGVGQKGRTAPGGNQKGTAEMGVKCNKLEFLKLLSHMLNTDLLIFSARQHICYSALYAIARPSVRPSVCPSVTRVDQSKTVEVRITQPSPQSSPMTLVS